MDSQELEDSMTAYHFLEEADFCTWIYLQAQDLSMARMWMVSVESFSFSGETNLNGDANSWSVA